VKFQAGILRRIVHILVTAGILMLGTGCGAGLVEEGEDVSVLEEEEIVKNPAVFGSKYLEIHWPRYDGIIPDIQEDIILENVFGKSHVAQMVVHLQKQRLAYFQNTVQNPEDILARHVIESSPGTGEISFPISSFGGTSSFDPQPGKYYLSAWVFNTKGDIIYSTAQFAFYLREGGSE
jgi:hypothetical protein